MRISRRRSGGDAGRMGGRRIRVVLEIFAFHCDLTVETFVCSAMHFHSALFSVLFFFFGFSGFYFSVIERTAGSIRSHRAGGRSSRVQINRRPRVSRFRGFLLADG